MTEAPPQPQPGDPPAKTWRDDTLSLFLVVSAVLLGAMYAYDQWQTSRLDDQVARADHIAQKFAVDGDNCGVSSTGLDGEVLVVHCAHLPAAKVATLAKSVDPIKSALAHFKKVAIRGGDKLLMCPTTPSAWPKGCTPTDLPKP